MLTSKETKEFLLLEIGGKAYWRDQLADRHPNDKARNLMASESLYKLYDHVDSLSENHQFFCWNKMATDSDVIEWFSNELNRFGFNFIETAEEFIIRIIEDGIIKNLLVDMMRIYTVIDFFHSDD